jgi:hypothetical protein
LNGIDKYKRVCFYICFVYRITSFIVLLRLSYYFVYRITSFIVLLQIRTKAALFQHSFGPRRDTLVYFFGMAVLFYGAAALATAALATAALATAALATSYAHFF